MVGCQFILTTAGISSEMRAISVKERMNQKGLVTMGNCEENEPTSGGKFA